MIFIECYKITYLHLELEHSIMGRTLCLVLVNSARCLLLTKLHVFATVLRVIAQSTLPRWFSVAMHNLEKAPIPKRTCVVQLYIAYLQACFRKVELTAMVRVRRAFHAAILTENVHFWNAFCSLLCNYWHSNFIHVMLRGRSRGSKWENFERSENFGS